MKRSRTRRRVRAKIGTRFSSSYATSTRFELPRVQPLSQWSALSICAFQLQNEKSAHRYSFVTFFFIQASKYAKMRERHDETMAKHEKTRQACKAVKECKWKEAADLFYKAADVTCLVQEGNYLIVFVLDESRSMVRRWLCTTICVHILWGCRRTRSTYTFADS